MFSASRIILALFFITLSGTSALVWAETPLMNHIQQAEKSIVGVHTELTRTMHLAPQQKATFERTAAGIVIDSSGIIVTNTHTIIHAPFIFVILRDGTKLRAHVVFSSKRYDLSFLKVHSPHPLQRIQWANPRLIKAGKPVIAIRTSEHNDLSIISGHIRNILHEKGTAPLSFRGLSPSDGEFLELDLDLHHGDSGGAILDEQGRLLGMIMAKQESQPNSSIAIPSNKIHAQYLQYKKSVP